MSKALSNTPEELVSLIIMTRTKSPKQTILIVEGSTDNSFLSSHIGKECKIISTNGKDKAIPLFAILENRSEQGVIGIIDADFAYLEKLSIPSNLFLTDTSDQETLCLNSPALEKVLFNTISPELDIEKICEQLRQQALELAKAVAYLRWVDSRNRHYNMSFNKMSFEKLINLKKIQLDEEQLLLAVVDNHTIREKVRTEVTLLRKRAVDLWLLCRGKDVLGIMAIILPTVVKNVARVALSDKQRIQTAANELARMLRIAYELNSFKETTLYKSVKQWEQDNLPFMVFK